MIASDNTRDPFYAYGDLDMLEVWREGVRILHLDYPFADWADGRARRAGARRWASSRRVLRVGAPRRHDPDAGARFHRAALHVRIRIASSCATGAAIDAAPPDYAELDVLEGLAP